MNTNMIFINSETKAKEYLNMESRIICYGEILSSFVMSNTELSRDHPSLSKLNFDFLLPIYEEIQHIDAKATKKHSAKQSEPINEETEFILQLYESMNNKQIKKKQMTEKCPIEGNYTSVNGVNTCLIDLPLLFAVNQIVISILNQCKKSEVLSKIALIKAQNTSSSVDEFDWKGKVSNFNYLKQLFDANRVQFRFSTNSPAQLTAEYKAYLYKSIIFFFYFFPFIFKNLTSVSIDFNIYQLLNYYREAKDPYSFLLNEMVEGGTTHDSLFLANFLSAMQLKELKLLSSLKICSNESHIIETQSLIKNKDSIFYLELLNVLIENKLDIAFNALDPLLFKRSIDLILKNRTVQHLSLDFFPQKPASFRKMCFNALYYNRIITQNDQNFLNPESIEDQYIDYVHLNDLTISDKRIISDDKLVKYVFKGFNSYLRQLNYVLEILTETLESLNLNMNQYPELLFYDSYNASIALFLFNLFLLLNYKIEQKNLERLSISVNAENYETLITSLMKDYQLSNKLGLNLPKLKYISLSLPNIRAYLSFGQFPYETIETLRLNKLSFEDFTELVKALKVSSGKMAKVKEIDVSLNYSDAVSYDIIGEFFRFCLPSCILSLKLEIPFTMSLEMIYTCVIKNILLNTRHFISDRPTFDLFLSIKDFQSFKGNKSEICKQAISLVSNYFKNKSIGDCDLSFMSTYSIKFLFNRIRNSCITYTLVGALTPLFATKCKSHVKRVSILKNVLYYVAQRKVIVKIHLKTQNEINRFSKKKTK